MIDHLSVSGELFVGSELSMNLHVMESEWRVPFQYPLPSGYCRRARL